MKRDYAVIFTGGLGPDKDKVKDIVDNAEIIVAADSGWDLAVSMGIKPDFFIGDMDSIDNHRDLNFLEDEKKMIFPEDKDYTDTELAIKFVKDKKIRDIVLIGGGGGRIDHTLALLAIFSRDKKPCEWYTDTEKIVYTDADCSINCRIGQTISVFAVGTEESSVTTAGLQWELESFRLGREHFSISNRAVRGLVDFRILKGAVLIIMNY